MTVMITAAVTLVLGLGYVAADVFDVAPGTLTTQAGTEPVFEQAGVARTADALVGDLQDRPIDASQAQELVDGFLSASGVGDDVSVIVADRDGTPIVRHNDDVAREPASTVKTLTTYVASMTLDMSSTLDTEVYAVGVDAGSGTATLVLKGSGDMLLGTGRNDPDHVNGRAGIGTLVERTAAALREMGVTSVNVGYDDSLFGDKRFPDGIEENNAGLLYALPMSSMAIDEGRDWSGGTVPSDPDAESGYPPRTATPAADTAQEFATQLAACGVSVNGVPTVMDTPDGDSPIASVSSAHLSEIVAYTLRNSDNTEAELFGRLLALATGRENSPEGAVAAVTDGLRDNDIDIEGLHLADCSGLTPGSRLTVGTLIDVQSKFVGRHTGAAAPSEGLAVSGLSGTALHRYLSDDVDGLVRLKTGTLGTVTSMTGNVSRLQGGMVLFAVIVNNPDNMWEASVAVDDLVGKLAEL